MSKRAINYVLFSILALIIVAGAFTPVFVNAQYTYGPDYTTFGSTGYYPDYSNQYYYPDYSSQYYYPQQNQYYYPTYPTEPRYYSYAPDPYYYGPQYYYPPFAEPQQYYTPPQYYPPYYPPQYPHYPDYDYDEDPLRVTCKVDTYEAEVGEYVTWTAKATGGTGNYRYSWAGDRMTNNDDERQVRVKYRDDGLKSPTVTVRSGDQRVVRQCPVIVVED